MLLQEFDFSIEHCPGANNELPDLQSRHPDDQISEIHQEERMVLPKTVPHPGKDPPNVTSITSPREKTFTQNKSLSTDAPLSLVLPKNQTITR